MDFLKFNNDVIDEFRANDGVCGGPFEGMPMILVTMTGAKSGRELCSPLVHSTDGGDPVIIASKAGAPEHPNWYYNLTSSSQRKLTPTGASGTSWRRSLRCCSNTPSI